MRATLVQDLARNKNRIKSFLYFHGIELPEHFIKNDSRWSNRYIQRIESLNMPEQSGNYSLQAIVTACKNLRISVLQIIKQIHELSKTEPDHENVILLRSISGCMLPCVSYPDNR